MKQYALTKQNEYVIKTIAKQLPDIPLLSINPNAKKRPEWICKFLDWLFAIHWPNGDVLVSHKIVLWVRRKYFGLNEHNYNHERRMRKAYMSNGIMGVVSYLLSIGTDQKFIASWIGDIKFTGDDLKQIQQIEKKNGIKLIN